MNVVGLIGQDKTGRRFGSHQQGDNGRNGGVAAMRTELENIAGHGDRDRGIGIERPRSNLRRRRQNAMVDLGWREPSGLDRRIDWNQFFKFNQCVEIPLPFSVR